MTNIQGDEIWLFVDSGIGFQTTSIISLEGTVLNIKNKIRSICRMLEKAKFLLQNVVPKDRNIV